MDELADMLQLASGFNPGLNAAILKGKCQFLKTTHVLPNYFYDLID
jgi:hypothetical protein